MSAIHDAARTVEQAAATERTTLTALRTEGQDILDDIAAAEHKLKGLYARAKLSEQAIDDQITVVEQADKALEVMARLGIKAADVQAPDEPTPIADGITRETTATLASPAYVPPVQQGTGGSPLLPTLIPPHGVETRDDQA